MRFCGVDAEGSTEDPSTPHFGEGLEKEEVAESARLAEKNADAQAELEKEQAVESPVEEVDLSEEVAEEPAGETLAASGGFFDFDDLDVGEASQRALGRVKDEEVHEIRDVVIENDEGAHELVAEPEPSVEGMEEEDGQKAEAETEKEDVAPPEEVQRSHEAVEPAVETQPSGGFFDFDDLEEAGKGKHLAVGRGKEADAHEAGEETEQLAVGMEKEGAEEAQAGLEVEQVVESPVEEVHLGEEVAEEPVETKPSGGFFDFDDLDEAEVA